VITKECAGIVMEQKCRYVCSFIFFLLPWFRVLITARGALPSLILLLLRSKFTAAYIVQYSLFSESFVFIGSLLTKILSALKDVEFRCFFCF
jgi:hypothetical protein